MEKTARHRLKLGKIPGYHHRSCTWYTKIPSECKNTRIQQQYNQVHLFPTGHGQGNHKYCNRDYEGYTNHSPPLKYELRDDFWLEKVNTELVTSQNFIIILHMASCLYGQQKPHNSINGSILAKNYNYFWTHGYCVIKTHTIATCMSKAPTHINTGTAENPQGGNWIKNGPP